MRNRILLILFVILYVSQSESKAQVYGNEWINYNQTYFKFKIYKDSIYRISFSELTAKGLPSGITGDQFQLFRDGQEVPIFVSNNGQVGSNDYIEFYGQKANGKVEQALYKDQTLQLNPEMNLISDTAYYFITYNTATPHLRFTAISNNLTNPPLKEAYFWDKLKVSYRNEFVFGKSSLEGQSTSPIYYNLNSSQYEEEGYVKKTTTSSDSVILTCTNPYTVSGGPFGVFKSTVVGKSYLPTHGIKIYANGNLIADSTYGSFSLKRFTVGVPMTSIGAQNKFNFKYTPYLTSGSLLDRFGISYIEFSYPRLFNFDNKTNFYFELAPKLTDYYIEISNFSTGNVSPRLYDLSTNQYLIGDINVAGLVRFVIPTSTQTKRLILQSLAGNNVGNVQNLESVTFKNYSLSSNQGNYIILSHHKLMDDGNGNNYLDQYRTYRSSIAGGTYNAIVADIEDLYNEFGYGYSFSSLGLKNFLHYAYSNNKWSDKPKHVFIIGKGINYRDYLSYSTGTFTTYPFYAVPSFGEPCSDLLLTDFDKDNKPKISIGRLSAFDANDIKNYLQKVKDYEEVASNTTNQTSTEKLWQKKYLHIAGTKSADEQIPILNSLYKQEAIVKKPYVGATVTTIKKSTTSSVEDINSKTIDNLINQGVSFMQFFGHSSASGLDYNLDFPENYTNYKKYPMFLVNGCGAGNIFVNVGQKYLSERFVLAANSGAIGFIANVNTGFTSSLGIYTDSLYAQIGQHSYGLSIGEQMNKNINNLITNTNLYYDFLFRMHSEQILLNGDPAIHLYAYAKPDYAVEEKGVEFKQLNLTTSQDSVDIDVTLLNLGKYTTDSVSILVRRILPNNIENVILDKKYGGLSYSDTLHLKIPTLGNVGLGVNALEVLIDQEAIVDEISETNNVIRRSFTIYNDDLVPVYPYQYSIVSNQGVTLKASTLNPFSEEKTYIFQLDTTQNFNSPILLKTTMNSKGGVLKWQPLVTLKDSVVYYWRTAMDTLYGNKSHRWTTSSFVYIAQSLPGWNQSHYFQHKENSYSDIFLDSASRNYQFVGVDKKLQVQNVVMNGPSPATYTWPDYVVKINGSNLYNHGCDPYPVYAGLQFIVIDTLTGQPWLNEKNPNASEGRFGSFFPCRLGENCNGATGANCSDPFFEFSFLTTASRQKIMNFLDSIPQGYYVLMQPHLSQGPVSGVQKNTTFIKHWKADTTVLGANNSLYHKLYNMGFTAIDSLYKNRPMIFWMQKGKPATIQQFVEADSSKKLYAEFNFKSFLYEGNINTSKIGPASIWNSFKMKGTTMDGSIGDTVSVNIIGIDKQNNETSLATVHGDTALSFIDAKIYPYVRLSMTNRDNNFKTPEQLNMWRIHYQPEPEAALNPNRHLVYKDTLGQGQIQHISVAVENLTEIPMDSLLVKYQLIDKNNTRTLLGTKRYKPLPILDTIHVDYDLNSSLYSKENTFEIEINPEDDQPEQFHPNNIGLKPLYIVADNKNPLIDVTFDGIHILDRDIISSKPFIHVSLKDENKYLALDDTSLISVFVKYPDDLTEYYIPFDGNVLKFIPADLTQGNGKNQARIEYKPQFTQDGDDYVLIIKAKDKSGNTSGNNAYKIGFAIINKPAISAFLNYPNPFTTSTQFIFTITGSEVPSNLKIQIIGPTGKVVREILKSELGPLHIGRNITEYKWKGDDQYGQLLGNGVYLYRVVTNLNGNKMDHYNSGADKWIEKGYGKLYIMR